MRTALEINFPGNQLAIDLSIVAGDLQRALPKEKSKHHDDDDADLTPPSQRH